MIIRCGFKYVSIHIHIACSCDECRFLNSSPINLKISWSCRESTWLPHTSLSCWESSVPQKYVATTTSNIHTHNHNNHILFSQRILFCPVISCVPSPNPPFHPEVQTLGGQTFNKAPISDFLRAWIFMSNLKLLHVYTIGNRCWIVLNCLTHLTTHEFPKCPLFSGF